MGSKSSSQQATNQTDNRRVIGEGGISAESSTVISGAASDGGILAQSGSSVTVLDNGAINKAFDFSTRALDATLNAQKSTANILSDAYNDAKGRGALTDYILIGAIAMAGIVAFNAVRK